MLLWKVEWLHSFHKPLCDVQGFHKEVRRADLAQRVNLFQHRARMPAAIPAARRAEIIQAVSAGLTRGTPLTVICESLQAQGAFAGRSIFNWLRDDPEAKLAIEYARDLGHDWLANECLQIADDRSRDVLYDNEGNPHPNGANVLSRKLAIDTRLKLLAKWSPRYREGSTLKVEGEITTTTRHVLDVRQLDEASRDALRALLDHAAAQGLLPGPETVDAEYIEIEPDADE